MTDVGPPARGSAIGGSASGCLRRAPSGMRHRLPDRSGDHRHETVSVLRGRHSRRFDDLQTLQAVHSQRPRLAGRRSNSTWALLADSRRRHRHWRARRLLDAHDDHRPAPPPTPAAAASFSKALLAAQNIGTQANLCESPTAVADAWRKLKVGKKEDPEWDHAGKMAAQLETCRVGHRQDTVVLHRRPPPQAAAGTGGNGAPQLADAGLRYDGQPGRSGPERGGHRRAAAQPAACWIASPATCRWAPGRSWKPGRSWAACRVTFTNNKQKWAYELPRLAGGRARRERAGGHGPGRAARAAVGPFDAVLRAADLPRGLPRAARRSRMMRVHDRPADPSLREIPPGGRTTGPQLLPERGIGARWFWTLQICGWGLLRRPEIPRQPASIFRPTSISGC